MVVKKLSGKHNVKQLCRIGAVSVSGYYKAQKSKKEKEDENDIKLIEKIAMGRKGRYGYRRITMELEREGVEMNHKKVLRLMRKYNFLGKTRRRNPYKTIMKQTQEHRVMKNVLNREFSGDKCMKKMGTDITYVRFLGRWMYLSIVKDMITGEILAHSLSTNLGMKLIVDTLTKLKTIKGLEGGIIHSDQGFHYTHPYFQEEVRKMKCIQSMSRRGNCLDNAPTESFFGHMKDEIDLSNCETVDDVETYFEQYIFYYNHHRPQWSKKKMTPVEYRNHLEGKH